MATTTNITSYYHAQFYSLYKDKEKSMATTKTAKNSISAEQARAMVETGLVKQLQTQINALLTENTRLSAELLKYHNCIRADELITFVKNKAAQVGIVPPAALKAPSEYLNWLDNVVWRLQGEKADDVLAE